MTIEPQPPPAAATPDVPTRSAGRLSSLALVVAGVGLAVLRLAAVDSAAAASGGAEARN